MKKQILLNLVKAYADKNDQAFRSIVSSIATEFIESGDKLMAEHLMELISDMPVYRPQQTTISLKYLEKQIYQNKSLYLPECIQNDVLAIARAAVRTAPISKVLFYGEPGTGKTECAAQIARLLERSLYTVETESIIDSRLGQTGRNIVELFEEIKELPSNNVVVLFDELDALVMDRIDGKDVREMGRVTSTFLKQLDELQPSVLIIATTNLYKAFDSALLRRFDVKVSFNRYTNEDLIEVSTHILKDYLKKYSSYAIDIKLFKKILLSVEKIPYPGEMSQKIKTSLALSDPSDPNSYLRRFYTELTGIENPDVKTLSDKGFTTREIEALSKISRSKVSRMIKG